MYRLNCLLVCLFFPCIISFAQPSAGGRPLSFSAEFNNTYPKHEVTTVTVETTTKQPQKTTAQIFTTPISTNFSLKNAGSWTTLPNGDRLWQLWVRVPTAQAMALLYKDFHLPKGARLYVFDAAAKQMLGAYTAQNNADSQLFLTGFIHSSEVIVEYFEPKAVQGLGNFTIFRIDAANRSMTKNSNDLGFGSSATCTPNVNCAAGDDLQREKRSVCRIMMVLAEGMGWCTGSFINNTAQDGKPYLLGAYHCQDGYTPLFELWRFDFNFEASGCANPTDEPSFTSVLGCELRAGWRDSDMLLLEITNPIPQEANLYLNGWNRSTTLPTATSLIHHPRGDIKKVTLSKLPVNIYPTSIRWQYANLQVRTPANHHFDVKFQEEGTFEIGSSGGAILNEDHLIVGQLHGGIPNAECQGLTTAFFGRFSFSWEGGGTSATRLKDWLDPLDMGIMQLEGMENPAVPDKINLQGYIRTEAGDGIANVEVTTDVGVTTTTDMSGFYLLEDVATAPTLRISSSKNINAANGLTNLDLIQIQKHILNLEPLSSNYKLLAADVNQSSSISNLDLIRIQKVILNIDTTFPNTPAWLFVPKQHNFSNTNNDFTYPQQITLNNPTTSMEDLDFVGIKVGDVNLSANRSE